MRNRLRSTVFAAMTAMQAFSLTAEKPHITIFVDDVYRADIVLPAKAGGVEKFAAEELAYHFRKAFGKEPEVVGEDAFDPSRHPFHIYIGATKAAAAAGLPVGKLADEEHVVKTVGNGLYLLGGDADTQAAIAGSIAEAFYGIPVSLINEADLLIPSDLKDVVGRFYVAIGIYLVDY